jgi:hypothetical protein
MRRSAPAYAPAPGTGAEADTRRPRPDQDPSHTGHLRPSGSDPAGQIPISCSPDRSSAARPLPPLLAPTAHPTGRPTPQRHHRRLARIPEPKTRTHRCSRLLDTPSHSEGQPPTPLPPVRTTTPARLGGPAWVRSQPCPAGHVPWHFWAFGLLNFFEVSYAFDGLAVRCALFARFGRNAPTDREVNNGAYAQSFFRRIAPQPFSV